MSNEVAIIGGGCFWCIEPLFDELKGVISVESGYSGGQIADPTYKQICTGSTGHAEVIRVTFDPAELSFRDLLGVFFAMHDPTTLNRQGYDTVPSSFASRQSRKSKPKN
jgi:peptide-methionine (S)-S-oxide reductase